MEKPIEHPAEESGDPFKEFLFWSKRFQEQLDYISDVFERFRVGQMNDFRAKEVLGSALERLRYISQQRRWLIDEIVEDKRKK